MAYSKKTWKDRITEYPNRRELTHSDSSTELVTVARSEGTISQEGDAFSAQNMNDLEGRIDSEFSAVDQSLQNINDNLTASNQTAGVTDVPFRFGCTDDGKFGYIINQGGADSVIPFSSISSEIINFDTVIFSEPSNTSSLSVNRTWIKNTYVRGIASNNYYQPSYVGTANASGTTIDITEGTSGYAFGLVLSDAYKSGDAISIQFGKAEWDKFLVKTLCYTADGTFLGEHLISQTKFTIPNNAEYVVIMFPANSNLSNYTLQDITVLKWS